jgi:hypothetical protein
MKTKILWTVTALALLAGPIVAQQTPAAMVASYESLADVILGVRQAERDFVTAMLDQHMRRAKGLKNNGNWEGCAAEMALFANEGDNAIGGVRKRLLEGGHHFNAAGEEQGTFEPGYVVVTRQGKRKMLAASTAMRQAKDDAAREAAWNDFEGVAEKLLK